MYGMDNNGSYAGGGIHKWLFFENGNTGFGKPVRCSREKSVKKEKSACNHILAGSDQWAPTWQEVIKEYMEAKSQHYDFG